MPFLYQRTDNSISHDLDKIIVTDKKQTIIELKSPNSLKYTKEGGETEIYMVQELCIKGCRNWDKKIVMCSESLNVAFRLQWAFDQQSCRLWPPIYLRKFLKNWAT